MVFSKSVPKLRASPNYGIAETTMVCYVANMPRQARIDYPGALHHIMVRGIERRVIFVDDVDRKVFVERLGAALEESGTPCYAWALMPNHVHLLLMTGAKSIGRVMQSVLTSYALYFNKHHKREGYLFQNRYKSILCNKDEYFKELIRYIHLNPLRGKVVKSLAALAEYPWCGHSVLLGKQDIPWQDKDGILGQFGSTKAKAVEGYLRFIEYGVNKDYGDKFEGGGIVRSLGGLLELDRARRKGNFVYGDARILGDSSFVEEVLRYSEEQES